MNTIKFLVRESPNEEKQVIPWDEGARKRFKLDVEDVALLESGQTLFRADTAFSIDENPLP